MCCVVGVKVTAGAPLLDVSVTTEPVRSPVTKDCELAVDPASFEYRDTSSSIATTLLVELVEVVTGDVLVVAVTAQLWLAVKDAKPAAARAIKSFLANMCLFPFQ
jgi:hypothetical protein